MIKQQEGDQITVPCPFEQYFLKTLTGNAHGFYIESSYWSNQYWRWHFCYYLFLLLLLSFFIINNNCYPVYIYSWTKNTNWNWMTFALYALHNETVIHLSRNCTHTKSPGLIGWPFFMKMYCHVSAIQCAFSPIMKNVSFIRWRFHNKD